LNKNILKHIIISKAKGKKLLAVLLDPDKLNLEDIPTKIEKINTQNIDYIFVGGSVVSNGITTPFVKRIKELTNIPTVLFPGDFNQLSNQANGILYLSLLSGRNPEYLIGQHVKSIKFLKKSNLEIIPTGYILIDGGTRTSTQKVSNTSPISQLNIEEIVDTAIAGEFLGKQLIYLEAGSGAKVPVDARTIKSVSETLSIPLIVGGGVRTKKQLKTAYSNGADLVVIGTAFEENNNFLNEIN